MTARVKSTKTRRRPSRMPRILEVEWIERNEVRLFFTNGKVVEMKLPVKSAKTAHIVDYGMGLDPGDGWEFSAWTLSHRRGRVLRRGRWGSEKMRG